MLIVITFYITQFKLDHFSETLQLHWSFLQVADISTEQKLNKLNKLNIHITCLNYTSSTTCSP